MTEQEFFQMFRDEAGALLSLPTHENLARFVTFDLSARPKPILVMELIRGTPLDRLLRSKALTMPRVIAHLDGILAGLEAMHAVDVGHLDVKASNVILRDGGTPVLVDFGLSGRALRPGCGTIEYTAPEVLGVVPTGGVGKPTAADIYAFGCLVYEMLTGQVLFSGGDELALVSKHVSHDGWLDELAQMSTLPRLDPLANLIGTCLRHDGKNRPTAPDLRNALTPALMPVAQMTWPLAIPSRAVAR
jgi:serine/threonine protein kinase